ncbi:polyprenol phosphomannose-dependent alpha 1,6 mannosyltransferase MptB [Catenuloplanes sp. NPDC051500]|uniref:polyprenol phosphomannose-dependent alpha 1,6 mannosyltransferase MptB n=1 Tax=Catenuloplanes sp. NPDC051500 TaxID=3363959 RepID=UPI00379DD229
MSSTNATLAGSPAGAPPGVRPLATGPVAAVGALATSALAAVTASSRLPEIVAITAGLIAMGAVAGAWLIIGRRSAGPRQLYAIAAAWGAPLLLAPPLFSGDVWSYLAQGATAAAGLDPYRLGPAAALGADSVFTQQVSHYWLDTPAPYGPAWMLLSRGVALLTGEHLTVGVLVYRLIAVSGLALIAWALPRLAARAGVAPSTALWLGLLNPLVLWHLLGGVHNDALMLGLMLAGLELALAGVGRLGVERSIGVLAAGVTLLTLAATIKFVAGAAFCVVVIALMHRPGRPVRPLVAVVAGAIAGTAALSAAAGFGWMSSPLGALSVYSWMSPTTATGMLIGALAGGDATPLAVRVANAAGLLVCVPVVAALLVAMARHRVAPIRGLGLIFTVALLCGAVVQPWYVLWAVLPLAASAGTARARHLIAAVSVAFAFAVPPLVGNAPAMIAGYVIATAVLGAAALVVHRRAVRRAPVAGQDVVIPVPRRSGVVVSRRPFGGLSVHTEAEAFPRR